MKKLIFTALVFLAASGPASAGARMEPEGVLLTGAHAQEVRSMLGRLPPRTVRFILNVGSIRLEGKNVRLLGKDLGQLSGMDDPLLNRFGNAYGMDAEGTLYFRGTLAAYLADERGLRNFSCRNIHNSGSMGYPGDITSSCVIH